MKIVLLFISLLVVMFACSPAKKLQKTSEAISKPKTDTALATVAAENKPTDSAQLVQNIFYKVLKNKINFSTFSAKVRAAYTSKEGNEEATAYVRLKKDSLIWLSLRGPLGIEGFRILITRDSVKVINLLRKEVQFRSISFLQEFSGIPFDFSALQDLIIGNPVFTDSNILKYSIDNNKNIQLLMKRTFFRHLLTIDTNNKIMHSELYEYPAESRTCDISYSSYDNSSVSFSTKRNILLRKEQSKSTINLDFKQHSFDEPLTFPFNVSARYKRI